MANIELTYTTVKFIVQQFKTDETNINFQKLNPGEHMSFNDNFWNYWVFDSYAGMKNAYPTYYSSDFPNPEHTYPDEEHM